MAKRWLSGGRRDAARASISGHARLLAEPAYQQLVAAEPLLRRLIPILIVIFLAMIGCARFIDLYQEHTHREAEARQTVGLVAQTIALSFAGQPIASASRTTVLNALADALPPGATDDGRRILVSDAEGTVIASSPRDVDEEGRALTEVVGETQPLTTFAERAGVLKIALPGGSEALAMARRLPAPLGLVTILEPMDAVYGSWRADVSLNVATFVGTSAILLVILYGYFAQVTRAAEADRIYSQTQARSETALDRGRCGLWDWDLARGRMFWSRSMFDILGLKPREELLAYGDVTKLVHPEDGELMTAVETLFAAGETTLDRIFRMKHVDGRWVWLRARAELVDGGGEEPHVIGIAVDVSDQMRLVERSQTADLRLRDAIETISEAFVLWDADNRLVMCNSKYQQLHGIPDAALIPGAAYADIIAAGRKPLVRSQVANEGKQDDGARSYEVQLEDGRWLQINERPTKDGGFVSVGTDITQLKRHEGNLIEGERRLMATIADLRQSRQKLEMQAQQMVELAEKYASEKDRAEAANRTKSQFLANVSHELRTPLNAIIGFSEIMQSGLFGALGSPKYAEYCQDIHQSGTYLLGVINDVLDMARIEAGRMVLHPEDVDFGGLVEESIRVIRAMASMQGVEVSAEIAPRLHLFGDRRALTQIMLNLLSNAVKFTPVGGHIRVRARVLGNAVAFTVADTGVGIPREAISKLGTPFEQVSNQFTKNHRGSGLGLAIASSQARLHGGAMRIRSAVGRGTVVAVRLPIDADNRTDARSAAA